MDSVSTNRYQSDPVDYLSQIAGLFRDYKRKALAFLECQEGEHLVDVGCGAGDDLLSLGSHFGEALQLTGIDPDIESLQAARKRSEALGVQIDFLQGDLGGLPLADRTVDVIRTDRVFQHLQDPEAGLREMIRVVKPGGRVVVVDVDWGSLVLDHPQPKLTDRIIGFIRDSHVNGRAGRQLVGAFHRAGLRDIESYADAVCVTDWDIATLIWALEDAVDRMVLAGKISSKAAYHWLLAARKYGEQGEFSGSMTGFVVRGKV